MSVKIQSTSVSRSASAPTTLRSSSTHLSNTMATLRFHPFYYCILLLFLTTSVAARGTDIPDDYQHPEEADDKLEVDRILSATDIVIEITKQREKHALQLIEIEKTLETEIKVFYKKHDAALSKLRTIDSELRQHVNAMESRVVAEAQHFADQAPSYSSWIIPFCCLVVLLAAVYIYLNRAMSSSVATKYS